MYSSRGEDGRRRVTVIWESLLPIRVRAPAQRRYVHAGASYGYGAVSPPGCAGLTSATSRFIDDEHVTPTCSSAWTVQLGLLRRTARRHVPRSRLRVAFH